MSASGTSVPSGRSPFPASRNPRTRSSAAAAAAMGGNNNNNNNNSSGLSRANPATATTSSGTLGSSIVGGYHYSSGTGVGGGHPLLSSSGMSSTMSATSGVVGALGLDSLMETSLLSTNTHAQANFPHHSQQSPVFHGLLRFSPNNSNLNSTVATSSWSPLHRGSSVTNAGRPNARQRFFESSYTNPRALNTTNMTSTTNTTNTTINTNHNDTLRSMDTDLQLNSTLDLSKDHSSRNNNINNINNINGSTTNNNKLKTNGFKKEQETVIDGIPIEQLRSLSTQALLQSPETSVFYSNILYAKTGEPQDALLLAKSHYAAAQYMTCLRILDEASLLQQEHPWDAVIVACLALQAQRNWVALAEMVEDVCRAPIPDYANNTGKASDAFGSGYNKGAPNFRTLATMSPPLEDDDGLGWMQLKQSIDSATRSSNIYGAQLQVSSTATSNQQDHHPYQHPHHQQQHHQHHQHQIHPLAQICYYRAHAYYEMSCMIRAVIYWKRSLQLDCQCQMAWEALLKRNLLTPTEAYDWIMHELTFQPQQEWLRSLYMARIELTPQEVASSTSTKNITLHEQQHRSKSTNTAAGASSVSISIHGTSVLDASSIHMASPIPSFLSPGSFAKGVSLDDLHIEHDDDEPRGVIESPIQEVINSAFDDLMQKHKLQDAPQVLAMAARRSYRRYEWKAALGYCEDLAQVDPAVSEAAYCYISTLVVLGYKRTLFRIAHEWVDAAPKSAQAWFAVGAYYYCIQRYHVAQRHFCRATRLDPQCTEAWIAFGCSFAACDESDQALASYRAAQRLSPGEHTSLLYMGMEYVRTNHLVLASYFLNASVTASGGDPLCLHELGVLASQKGEHKTAIYWFRKALCAIAASSATTTTEPITATSSLTVTIDLLQDTYWEPTLFNLGHSYRKTRQFDNASICFHRCIGLCPDKFSTYAALAFTKQLQGHLDKAISLFHQALSLKSDDPFSTEMLNRALREQTMARRQQIFETSSRSTMTSATIPPPLAEATNFSNTREITTRLTSSSLASSVLLSPQLRSSSRLKDDKNTSSSRLSEEMDCDLSTTS